jgi:hypothetical protein
MGLLKVAAPDFAGGNLRGYGQHGGAAAMSVEQPVDEVEIAWTARTGAYRELACDLRFTCGCECSYLLMPNMNPVDLLSFAQRFGQTVQAVTDHAENALYPGLNEGFRDEVGDIFDTHGCRSFLTASAAHPRAVQLLHHSYPP